MGAFRTALALSFAALTQGLATQNFGGVTPVEKVITLLGKLQAQVEEEGKKEAANYDKYACFCKEQADNKLYAIETSKEKIAALDAKIEKLGAEITTLETDASALGTKITGLTSQMTEAQNTRNTEHDQFVAEVTDVDAAIDAVKRALEALDDSKKAMAGKVEREAEAMAQLKAISASSTQVLGAKDAKKLQSLTGQPGKAYESTFHSNEIIEILESLLSKFEAKKTEIEQEEFDTNTAFEKRQLDLSNEKKFAAKEKAEKEALAQKKTELKATAEADRAQEQKEMTADQEFLNVLTEDCQTKANLWDQRSQTRADELRALEEAMTALKEGVAPNWQANKRLVDLQKNAGKVARKGHWVYVEEPAGTPTKVGQSFLQLRRSSHRASSSIHDVASKIAAKLATAAKELKSPLLSAASLKVSLSEDHFVKVRELIKDLVSRLEAQAADEKTAKMFCDEEMSKAITSRDASQGEIETLEGEISTNEAAKAALQQEVAVLSKEIADLKKALMEASELRSEENKENTQTIEDAGAGREAVEQALEVLKAFYEGSSALLQKKFVPTNSDREGNTVKDLAPEVFDSKYQGSQEASKGIIGMLEVILSDFDRTDTVVTGQEADAASAFATFKTENEADTSAKEEAVKLKEGEIADIEDTLNGLTDSLKAAKESRALALEELAKLESMCVAGDETYEERAAKRQKEIEALKEAHNILEEWSS